MNSQEPFKRDYGYIFIVTPEDKAKYGPKRELDESWTGLAWMPSGIFNGCSFHPELSYRRPISKPVESGWVSVKERWPEINQCVLAVPPNAEDLNCGLLASVEIYCGTSRRWVKTITHWMPLPPAPQPPRPTAEVAFDEAYSKLALGGGTKADCKLAWLAAIAWAKSHLSELSKEVGK